MRRAGVGGALVLTLILAGCGGGGELVRGSDDVPARSTETAGQASGDASSSEDGAAGGFVQLDHWWDLGPGGTVTRHCAETSGPTTRPAEIFDPSTGEFEVVSLPPATEGHEGVQVTECRGTTVDGKPAVVVAMGSHEPSVGLEGRRDYVTLHTMVLGETDPVASLEVDVSDARFSTFVSTPDSILYTMRDGDDETVHAVDVADMSERWRDDTRELVYEDPFLDGPHVTMRHIDHFERDYYDEVVDIATGDAVDRALYEAPVAHLWGALLYVDADENLVLLEEDGTAVDLEGEDGTRKLADYSISPGYVAATVDFDGGLRVWDRSDGSLVVSRTPDELDEMEYVAGAFLDPEDHLVISKSGASRIDRVSLPDLETEELGGDATLLVREYVEGWDLVRPRGFMEIYQLVEQ